MGRVEDVKDALPKRARNDKPVVIEEEAVALKHAVPGLPVRAAQGRVVGDATTERRDHVGVLRLVRTGHGHVAGGNGNGSGR